MASARAMLLCSMRCSLTSLSHHLTFISCDCFSPRDNRLSRVPSFQEGSPLEEEEEGKDDDDDIVSNDDRVLAT